MIDQNFSEWNPESDGIDFRKISTPSTTKAVIFNFDELWPDECPAAASKYMKEVFESVSDNVTLYENKNATVNAFLDELENGKTWHYFLFYVFAHGGNKCFSLWNPETGKRKYVMSTAIWDKLGDAKKRFIGMFDNCYSGSQLNVKENEDGTLFASSFDGQTVFSDLYAKFMMQDLMLQASADAQKPMFQLWASTQAGHVGQYTATSSTKFSTAIYQAWKKMKDSRYPEFWDYVVSKGSYGKTLADDNKQKIVPQKLEYGESFSESFAVK